MVSQSKGIHFYQSKLQQFAPKQGPNKNLQMLQATMKLGFNSVLFGNFDPEKAFIAASEIGYSGIELSALDPAMSEHINESDPVSQNISLISGLIDKYNIPVTAIERAKHDLNSWEYIVQLADGIGCPIINLGPGGSIDPNGVPISGGSFDYAIESLKRHSEISNKYNITTCFKAHYNTCIDNTELSKKAVQLLENHNVQLDFDPSHIFRVPEDPVSGLKEILPWIGHVHIRDCIAEDIKGPGSPFEQICGRGKIDLNGILRLLKHSNYEGPVNLEVIGAKQKNLSLPSCTVIAAESKGWLNSALSSIEV
ncbi:MAG: xylose isomerase [Euryarchaeota archaeon]|nr:xylose isomerase [Euryarchaeota archaeon]